MTRFLFRQPVFPALIETDSYVKSVRSLVGVSKLRETNELIAQPRYQMVDSNGEGWSYEVQYDAVTPLVVKKKWSKKEIIAFYSSSLDEAGVGVGYEAASLSDKRVHVVVKEIAEMSNRL